MSYRIDVADWIVGSCVVGNTGLGVLGSAIPRVGPAGEKNLFYADLQPTDNNSEIRALIISRPITGVFVFRENGLYTFTGAANGYYPVTYQLYVNGVARGGVRTYVITVGNLLGLVAGPAQINGASLPSDHADYKLLSANDRRSDILAVPGSGPIRGVWIYKDVVYAFRDNVGATSGDIFKATTGGWVQVAMGRQMQFTGGIASINEGDTLTGATNGATATVVRALVRTGSWGFAAAGTLILSNVIGSFAIGETLRVGGATKATAASLAALTSRMPGGKLEFINANFTGSTLTQKVYGCDGVNPAFEFDGASYTPILTGMSVDTPKHLAFHKNYLFLSFHGSVQYSALGNPFAWTAILGAGELSTGEEVTGMLPQAGNAAGASMAIFTKGKTFVLYGAGAASFQLIPSVYDLGYSPGTIQAVSNNTFGLTGRGIQALTTTQTYGNFNFAAVSFLVQSLVNSKAGLETVATTTRTKNQYRLYYGDGSALVVGLTGDKISGILPLNYGRPVRCICTDTLSNGKEMTIFGSDDGYVYQDSTGTSFDGGPIEAWIRPAFNNLKSPRIRKRFRRAVFEVHTDGFSKVNATYDLGYSSPNVAAAAVQKDISMIGSGGYWGQFTWDQFTWDTEVYSTPQISIEGTEKNISFLFYSNRAQDNSHLVSGISLQYSLRRAER